MNIGSLNTIRKKSLSVKWKLVFIPVLIFLLNSCIGLSMNIQMNRNGSGRITMEFRISRFLDIGTLDGNEHMPAIPVGRQDWERTVQRIPGARLISHSTRETSGDIIITAVLGFSTPQALAAIIDPSEEKVSINHNGQNGSLSIIISDESDNEKYDPNLAALMNSVFSDYSFSVVFNAPGNSALIVTDGTGNSKPMPSSAAVVSPGRRISFSMNINEILYARGGIGVTINW